MEQDPLDQIINDSLGGGESKTITVVHEDGSRWLHSASTGEPIRQMTGPTQAAQAKTYGYVSTAPSGPSDAGITARTSRTPIVEQKMVNDVLYGRAEGESTYRPLQDFSAPQAGAAARYREFGGNLYQETPEGLKLVLEKGPAAAPQRAPRYPEEIELDRLKIQQMQQELMDPFSLAQQQYQQVIQTIQEQLAAGELSVEEADRMVALSKANLEATLQGTSPWQMEQARKAEERSERQQRQSLASGLVNQQMSSGSSMANSLLSGASGIYGGILKSSNAPLNFDPLAMAKGFVTDMAGGPDMAQMAQAILRGALSPQGGQQ